MFAGHSGINSDIWQQDITLENFAGLIDDQSWEEFMPRGVTKELFAEFAPYYDPDMFRAVGRNYRDLVRAADEALCFRGDITLVCLVNGRLAGSEDYDRVFAPYLPKK